MIRTIVLNGTVLERQVDFWTAATGCQCAGSDGHDALLVPRTGSSPPLVLQPVSDPSPSNAGVDTDDLDRELDRLVALGATTVQPTEYTSR